MRVRDAVTVSIENPCFENLLFGGNQYLQTKFDASCLCVRCVVQ